MVDGLDKRLKELCKSRIRFNFLTRIYEEGEESEEDEESIVSNTSLPHACIEALDVILADFAQNRVMPVSNLVVAKYDEDRKIKPYHKVVGGEVLSVYGVRFFYQLCEFKRIKGKTKKPLHINIELDRTELVITYHQNGCPKPKHYTRKELLYCSDLTNKRLNGSIGAGLKMAAEISSREGRFRLGAMPHYVAIENPPKPIIIFFEKREIYAFDLYGNRLTVSDKILH